MIELKNEKIAIPVVLFAGILWSFGPLVVRYINQPELVPWQYLFTRGLTIFFIINVYLFLDEGKNFYKNYLKIGVSGDVGGSGLGIAMITFTLFGCNAIYYSFTWIFVFKRKNFTQCLDSYNYSSNRYSYNGFW